MGGNTVVSRVLAPLALAALVACGSADPTVPPDPACEIVADVGDMEVVAHRGYAGCWPENTLEAVRNSAPLLTEVDVWTMTDGRMVLSHDSVPGMDKLPTVDDALALGVPLMLDLKGGPHDLAWMARQPEILTWSIAIARALRDKTRATLIYRPHTHGDWKRLVGRVDGFLMFAWDISAHRELTDSIVAAGVPLTVTTIHNPEAVALARSVGAWRILTDYPIRAP